jgi:hypothetical protein
VSTMTYSPKDDGIYEISARSSVPRALKLRGGHHVTALGQCFGGLQSIAFEARR